MDTSVRTLQRELRLAGADFRGLTSAVRMQRATEMLRDGTVSITNISEDLGYSSPAGFSRAFRKATGFGPREFRVKENLSAGDPDSEASERTSEL
ncbi:Helix-turn-helix domain protein [compost metagenome]